VTIKTPILEGYKLFFENQKKAEKQKNKNVEIELITAKLLTAKLLTAKLLTAKLLTVKLLTAKQVSTKHSLSFSTSILKVKNRKGKGDFSFTIKQVPSCVV